MKGELPIAPQKVILEILDSLTSHSMLKRMAVILSIFIPGVGCIICGQKKRGVLIFIVTVTAMILAYIISPRFLHDNSIPIALLHILFTIGAIIAWIVNIEQCIVSYEINIEKLLSKFKLPDDMGLSKIIDRFNQLTGKMVKEGRLDNNANLDKMIDDPRYAIITMSIIVSMTFIATKVNAFLDKIWISDISLDAMSAVSTVSSIYSVVAAIGVGIGTGACVCISYTLGKRNFERSQELATASLFLSILISIPTAIFMIFAVGPVTEVQGEVISRLSMDYIIPLALGCPFIILSGVIGSLFKAEGAMKVMTFCALVSVPVNAILTPIFIKQFGWGIMGASLATVIGSAVSTALSYYMFGRGKYHFKLRFAIPSSAPMKEILTVGGPKALEELLGGIIILVQTLIISVKTGSLAVAVTSIGFSFPYLMTMIPDSISAGSTPVCSAQAGAHNVDVMRSSIKYTVTLTLALSIVAMIVMLIFADPINSIFIGNKQIDDKELLLTATRTYALLIPFYLVSRTCSNMLQVVRKSHISAPVYIGMGFLRLGALFLFGTTIMNVVYVEVGMNVLLGIVMLALLVYYTGRFDPDRVDNNEDSWFGRMDSIKDIMSRWTGREEKTA